MAKGIKILMGNALGIISIIAGALLVTTSILTIWQAAISANLTASFLVMPIIYMALGALLMALGNRSIYPGKVGSAIEPKSVFCRYCGKKTAPGDYCSACGKSSQSTSVSMKICRGCSSTMSEDSKYCANCGKELRQL